MDNKLKITSLVIQNLKQIVSDDKKNIFYFLYYSMIEAILLMVSPLTSAFIINSVLAHATISITVLSFIIIVIFVIIAILQVLKEYMVEKFEQKIFVKNAIKISKLALDAEGKVSKDIVDKYMNYFFDVISIQKLFPVILLNGSGLLIKVVVSLILLFLFDPSFFILGLFFIILFAITVLFLGRNGAKFAIQRSDAKHEAIYYLQNIPVQLQDSSKALKTLDRLLSNFVYARQNMFKIIVKQLSITFFIEGVILGSFFIVGGYFVFKGMVPIGEFVATEIIIISVVNALRDFMKQIDYMYDMIEGFYKINKLSAVLEKS